MTKAFLHALKKLLRISVLVAIVSSGTINASAAGSISETCSASCNSQLNVSLDGSGYALIDPATVWAEGYSSTCFTLLDSVVVEIEGAPSAIQPVTLYGHTISTTAARINCSFVGQNLTYNLKKYYSNGTINSCWGNVLIEDKMLPTVACTDLYIYCTDDTNPYQLDNYYNNAFPTTFDNCGTVDLTFEDSLEDYECTNPDYLRRITRTWTAIDPHGNQSTCQQYIYIQKADGNEIQFPEHLTGDDALSCLNPDLEPSNTGYPTIYGKDIIDHELCAFSIDYQDQQIGACGGSYKVIRNWTVLDWCTNEIFTHSQIIKVADKNAPTIICPFLPEIGTTTSGCSGNVNLPQAIISDDCSNYTVITETPNGIINGNGGLVIGLPLGDHIVTYTAEDDCGNISSCSTTITVVDNVPPITICDEHTSVSLVNDGTAIIFAETFDDGSYDNCEIANYEVRRMDNPNCPGNDASSFGPSVAFSCCDLGSIVLVELKITDVAGNSNSCMVEVEVEDKLNPVIVCPSNKTLECKTNYENLSLTGEATATDNCSTPTVTYQDIAVNIDQCGVGSVTRVWTATDAQGLTASCIQTITLVNNDIFDEYDFTFPYDYNTAQCGGGDLSPDNLPTPYDYPIINDDACDLVATTYEDQILPVAAPACFKILRKWIIVDWCQYDPNYVGQNGETPGRWEHVQIIKVTDNDAPVFTTCPSDLLVENFEANCGTTFVALTAEATDCSEEITYSYAIDINNDGTDEIFGNGNDASDAYANGIYNITFTATDGCGNATDCSYLFTVVDAKKPTPICINGLSSAVMPSAGMMTIWATDFESGSSYDNCTNYNDLLFSFSSDVNDISKTFTCDEIGNQPIELWVTDAAGNQDFCTTFIFIDDNANVCNPIPTAAITGVIENEMGEEVEDVTIEVNASNVFPIVTSANGLFNFAEIPTGNAYTVTPQKDMNHSNGISTFDLVLITKHILGIELLDSPYKIIAADANHSGSVTSLDIVKLRRLILQLDTQLQQNTSWRFVDANYTFTYPNNPLAESFPEIVDIANLDNNTSTSFVAIKVGDVNGSASPNSLLGTETRNELATLDFDVEEKTIQAGETFTVNFTTRHFQEMMGFQFTLNFDETALNFEDVKTNLEGLTTENFGFTQLENGNITVSWNHSSTVTLEDKTNVFSLVFEAKRNTTLSESLEINSTATIAEAYSNANSSALGTSDVMNVQLTFNGTATTPRTQLFQNQPNPVATTTTIPFRLAEGGAVTLKVIDLNGKTIQLQKGNFPKGDNKIQLNNLKGSGVMYYQLETEKETLVKKMIVIGY